MSEAFKTGAAANVAGSDSGDDSPSRRGTSGFSKPVAEPGSTTAAVRAQENAQVLAGTRAEPYDKRKFKYDVLHGRGKAQAFYVTRDDRMSVEEAAQALHAIHVKYGLESSNAEVLHSFDDALWFCHTVNGGSVLVPGRSKFSVPGVTVEFDYSEIRDILGVDMRRFFRAFADDITRVNLNVLRDYAPNDSVAAEQWGWLTEVAFNRGLQRFPHLAHDSADACLNLSPVERQALNTSKVLVIGATPNAADRLIPGKPVVSADRYDSSVGTRY